MVEYKIKLGLQEGQTVTDIVRKHWTDCGLVNYAIWCEIGTIISKLQPVTGAIPQKRTTMAVEALWRNFKRMVLYHYNWPCVDLATHALFTQVVPPYWLWFNQIVNDPWDGHTKCMHGEQHEIQQTWFTLCKCPAKGSYTMDLRGGLGPDHVGPRPPPSTETRLATTVHTGHQVAGA